MSINIFVDGRGGYDEYYDELPEQTEDRINGRGGDGVVIRNGRIRGNIVGIGGQGRSRGYYRRKRETLNQPSLDGMYLLVLINHFTWKSFQITYIC